MNGIGERCGNVDLCSDVANLELKMNKPVLGEGHLQYLRQTSHYVSDNANLSPNKRQAYQWGCSLVPIRVASISTRITKTFSPTSIFDRSWLAIGNESLVSDHTGRSGVVHKLEEYGVTLSSGVILGYDTC